MGREKVLEGEPGTEGRRVPSKEARERSGEEGEVDTEEVPKEVSVEEMVLHERLCVQSTKSPKTFRARGHALLLDLATRSYGRWWCERWTRRI